MSDTIQIRPGDVLVPPSTGENTTETYGVWYPFDGLFAAAGDLEDAKEDAEWALTHDYEDQNRGALILKVTLERIDP